MKNPERYNMLGAVTSKAASVLREEKTMDFFVKLIQRVAPKSTAQAHGEVLVTQKFLENFSGDQVRFLAKSFSVSGDRTGQTSHGHRWPYGPVALIAPFNFPLEIALLQLMGALYMGNKVLLKSDSRVSVVMEQALRLLHSCGLPMEDVDFINCEGEVMHRLLMEAQPRMTQFTGSSRVAELLARDLHGRLKIEDAGFNWKILGPDVGDEDFVSYTCDQDAYAFSGQKCSAQSLLFVHENWVASGLLDRLKTLASRRNLHDLTIGPILTVNNDRFLEHLNGLLSIPSAKLLFGGSLLSSITPHKIPSCYGSWNPTAVEVRTTLRHIALILVPLSALLQDKHFSLCTKEIFGPLQVVVRYEDRDLDRILEACERIGSHLTAAVVSNDVLFQNKVVAHTINGTTYCGRLARTTGAPQNHWFGPAGDPRAAGIGTSEAIRLVWSCHREVIMDQGPVSPQWTIPEAS